MKDFKAFKFHGSTDIEVEVCQFNGMMAICSDDEGPVLITKEQASEFFDFEAERVAKLENVIRKLLFPCHHNCTFINAAKSEAALLLTD